VNPAIVDCRLRKDGLGLEEIRAFRRDGVLILRDVLSAAEMAVVDKAATELIDWAWGTGIGSDVYWTDEPGEPGAVPVRIEYPMDKSPCIMALAGHPLLLGAMEALVGPNLIPTWDSLVFKVEQGAPGLAWHRDGGIYAEPVSVTGSGRIIDVGIYLDAATADNCVWAIPGSNYWDTETAAAAITRQNEGGWCTEGALPALMEPGDVLLHNVLTLHGAPPIQGSRRRVVYFEYRPAEVELHLGPHNREYIGRKQQVLLASIAARAAADVGRDELPFVYRPADAMRLWSDAPLTTARFPHEDYWTWPTGAGGP
jgi:phytanoyl-CoA hydroxylase